MDAELSALALPSRLQAAGEPLLGRGGVDLDRTLRLFRLRSVLARWGGELLEIAGGEAVAHGAVGELDLCVGVLETEQRTGLAGGEPPLAEQVEHLVRQAEEAERVGHRGTRLADAGGDLLLRKA